MADVHHELGPSSAHRWFTCPRSVAASKNAPEETSEYAEEGTKAHRLLEAALMLGTRPTFGVEKYPDLMELAAPVDLAYDWIMSEAQGGALIEPEQVLDIAEIGGFGTVDAVILPRARHKMIVVDYKHGAGVLVDAYHNPQLMLYALGARQKYGKAGTYDLVIIQPNAPHIDGPIRTHTVTDHDLDVFAKQVVQAVKRTEVPDAPFVPGSHCRFCPVAGSCAARAAYAQAVTSGAPDVGLLTDEALAVYADYAELLAGWISALKTEVHNRLATGKAIPGWTLGSGRSTRSWINEQEVTSLLTQYTVEKGVPFDTFQTPKELRSPAQVEKLLKSEKDWWQKVNQYVSVTSGKAVAVKTDSGRPPPVIGAEFQHLLTETQETKNG